MKSLQQQEELLSDHIANQRRLMEQRQAEVQKKQSIEAKRLQKMNAKLDQERTEMLILKEAGNFDDNNRGKYLSERERASRNGSTVAIVIVIFIS